MMLTQFRHTGLIECLVSQTARPRGNQSVDNLILASPMQRLAMYESVERSRALQVVRRPYDIDRRDPRRRYTDRLTFL